MPIGFFFITFGLVTGAVWGKICWGDFWQYDPKEMWSLASWLCYAGYFIFRRWTYPERIFRYLGGILIILTLTWVNFSNLFKGLHSYA
jgi:ABC-type transport system involved in cytochrome c biogenesis permease subunit